MTARPVTTEARWRGRPLSDLTREELIQAMHDMDAGHKSQLADRDRTIELLLGL